ncbi:MAG: PqqD family protein [Lachnospiraceae bacterium]|nr:PqqD family protein [Lachnospiraceae bacterium]
MSGKERYQLRHAAGKYWLLDMTQDAKGYRAPVAMNETGAIILNNFWATNDEQATAKVLSDTYEIDLEEALADVRTFLRQLEKQGIVL